MNHNELNHLVAYFYENTKRTFNFVPKCTKGPLEMGLNLVATIKLFSFGCSLQEQFVGLNCVHLTNCCIAGKLY